MVPVTLTEIEFRLAVNCGVEREIRSRLDNRQESDNTRMRKWWPHIEGACGEAAVAKYLNIFWCGSLNTFCDEPDTGPFEVRSTEYSSGHLATKKKDQHKHQGKIFVLVTGYAPKLFLAGWKHIEHCALSQYWRPDMNQYFTPQSDLNNINTLRDTDIWMEYCIKSESSQC